MFRRLVHFNAEISLRIAMLVALCCVVAGGFGQQAHAQSGMGVAIQPSIIEERLDPGATISGMLTVRNEDGGRQTYYIVTRNIAANDLKGRPVWSDIPADDPQQLAAWIHVKTESLTLEVGETGEVQYEIQVPAGASPGSYTAAIFATREAERTEETGAGVGFQVASLVNLRVNGDANEALIVREFSTDGTIYREPNVAFMLKLENTGTVFERPIGIIEITDMLGNDVAKIEFNKAIEGERNGGVLPKSTREYEERWSTDKFSLGRYRAKATIVFGDQSRQSISRDTSFWVIPIKEVGIVLGTLAFIIIGFIYGLRAYVRKALREAGHVVESRTSESEAVSFARRVTRTLIWVLVLMVLLFIVVIVFNA